MEMTITDYRDAREKLRDEISSKVENYHIFATAIETVSWHLGHLSQELGTKEGRQKYDLIFQFMVGHGANFSSKTVSPLAQVVFLMGNGRFYDVEVPSGDLYEDEIQYVKVQPSEEMAWVSIPMPVEIAYFNQAWEEGYLGNLVSAHLANPFELLEHLDDPDDDPNVSYYGRLVGEF